MQRASFVSSSSAQSAGVAPPWEVRPGGMVVQTRDGGPGIRVNVAYGPSSVEFALPGSFTFGELKGVIAHEIGIDAWNQRILFRGKNKEDSETLHAAGVKDGAKLLLLEKPMAEPNEAQVERKEEVAVVMDEEMEKACEAVICVRSEVDALAEKVVKLEMDVHGLKKIEDKEFAVLSEMLMVQLLKLDGIEAQGEARIQRKNEVCRIQSLVETLDILKARNSNPFGDWNYTVSDTTQWETSEPDIGSTNPPRHTQSSRGTDDDNWERFD